MSLPTELVLGGFPATWVWTPRGHPSVDYHPRIPAAVLIDHGDHTLLVPWAQPGGGVTWELFTLKSLKPLTVAELITCATCGVAGRIIEDRWFPVDEVARG